MRELHPARAPRYDTELARTRRQAGVETYEYDSDEPESGDWEDWGPPSPCSRYKHFTIYRERFLKKMKQFSFTRKLTLTVMIFNDL